MGMQFSEDEVDEMIREVDVDGRNLKFYFFFLNQFISFIIF